MFTTNSRQHFFLICGSRITPRHQTTYTQKHAQPHRNARANATRHRKTAEKKRQRKTTTHNANAPRQRHNDHTPAHPRTPQRGASIFGPTQWASILTLEYPRLRARGSRFLEIGNGQEISFGLIPHHRRTYPPPPPHTHPPPPVLAFPRPPLHSFSDSFSFSRSVGSVVSLIRLAQRTLPSSCEMKRS